MTIFAQVGYDYLLHNGAKNHMNSWTIFEIFIWKIVWQNQELEFILLKFWSQNLKDALMRL